MYCSSKSNTTRLGSFEGMKGLGAVNTSWCAQASNALSRAVASNNQAEIQKWQAEVAKCNSALQAQRQATTTSSSTGSSSGGSSAADIMTGIAAVLNPVAGSAANIFSVYQQHKLQSDMMKQGGMMMPAGQMPPQSSGSSGLLIALAVVAALGVGIFIVINK